MTHTVLIQDSGFVKDDWSGPLLDWDVATQGGAEPTRGYGLDIPNTVTAQQLQPYFETVGMIRIFFPNAHDGRGFTIARTLRLMGYTGRLRAFGHVIADQYAMARRVGFDEIEIEQSLAERQPEPQWRARANWTEHRYLNRLQKSA
ncbi:DUF934 domain-containing protein [Neptunicoccus cionae]|uniref:Oxidoreductase n=1 Tax=Neptunicoccus cionae TaxID=2035344 RepID=A0A916R0U4_9RHOB|nr:DUF934 domain-containing protein [Amylibacter cionae]GGA24898.1 hypothetical protein GCM10011498_27400 [Amylibacter cionae]